MPDEGTPMELYLSRGRLVILNAFVWRQEDGQWHARLVHRHEGELAMCPGHVSYSNLSTEELADVLQGTLDNADSRFSLQGDECHPMLQ